MKINLKPIEIITLFLILMALAGLFYIILHIDTEGLKCMSSPLSYFENKTDSRCFCFDNNMFGVDLG